MFKIFINLPFVIFLLLIGNICTFNITNTNWTMVFVLPKIIFGEAAPTLYFNLASRLSALALAETDPDWFTVCKQTDSRFAISKVQVSPLSKNATSLNGIPCYTKLKRDLFYGTGGAVGPNPHINRTITDLASGINVRQHDGCAESSYNISPWILANLNAVKPVKTIIVTAHNDGWQDAFFTNVTISYSTGPFDSNDFSNFNLFTFYNGTPYEGESLTFNVISPVKAQYILFQKYNGNDTFLMICHLQIFST